VTKPLNEILQTKILEQRSGALLRAYELMQETAKQMPPAARKLADRALLELEAFGQSLEREYRSRGL
jgi:hypothetical protein